MGLHTMTQSSDRGFSEVTEGRNTIMGGRELKRRRWVHRDEPGGDHSSRWLSAARSSQPLEEKVEDKSRGTVRLEYGLVLSLVLDPIHILRGP